MYEIIFFLLIPFIAMFYEGLHRKINARLQNRIGPPIIQPFYDVIKLFQKKNLRSQNDPFFKYAPLFYFLSTYTLFLFIPFSIIGSLKEGATKKELVEAMEGHIIDSAELMGKYSR